MRFLRDFSFLEGVMKHHREVLHEVAELGREEFKTSEYIRSYLDKLGVEYDEWLGTGTAGIIRGKDAKRTIAFRADIDGLMTECGVQHLCGHDGHTSILLGLVEYVNANKEKLNDNFVFIFQPAEEGPGGSEDMVKDGIIEYYGIDEIYGLHVNPLLDEGVIGIKKGPMMAGTIDFEINIVSKSAHGAMPQNGIDGIVISAEVINSLQTIVSRNISPIDSAVITVGKIRGGARRNIVAENVSLEGTVRYAKDEVYANVLDRMKKICEFTAAKYDCKIEMSVCNECRAVINDDNLYQEFKDAFKGDNVVELDFRMGAEDFAFFQRAVPGFFFNVGTRNEEKGFTAGLHNEQFDFDEKIILNGVEVYRKLMEYKNMI